jgi:DNA-directed RNA polymerase subunit omega
MDALSLLPNGQDQKLGSRSRLVIVTAQRARQIMQGHSPLIQTKQTKPTTIALEEVLKDQVDFLVGKEAKQAMKEAKKLRERELERLTVTRVSGEDANEIKRDLSVMVDDSKPIEPNEDD